MIEDKIQKAIKPIISIYSQIELDIIERIAEHFKINEEFINSDYWYFEKLKELGGLNNETIKLLEKYTGRTKQELLKAMNDIGINAIPTEQLNIATQKGALLNPEDIINSTNIQNIIKFSYNEIENSFLQLNKAIQEQVRKTYTDIITQTYIKTSSGIYSYQEAILESLDELGNKGISVLEYQTDKGIRNYDVVGTVRRDLLCATRGLAAKVNEEVIKESGNHIVRVSHHFGARIGDGGENYTNHAWWQEKQFFCWNYDGKATEEEKKLPDFMEHCNYGDVQGIVGINCKHFFTVWYGQLKKDELDFTYEENKEQYEKTQQQRYLENGVRKWKRKQVIANKAEDKEGYEKASKKTKEWQERIKTFTKDNNLKRDYTREHVKNTKVVTNKDNNDIIKPSYIRKNTDKDYDTTNEEENIKTAIELMPEKLKNDLNNTEFEIITRNKTNKNYSRYDRTNNKFYIYENSTQEEVIHEIGHYIETKYNILNNKKYIDIRSKGLNNCSIYSVKDLESYSGYKGITNSKFISELQGLIYKKDLQGKSYIGNNQLLNLNCLGEYFSEGFRAYWFESEKLKNTDLDLFNYIKEVLENVK